MQTLDLWVVGDACYSAKTFNVKTTDGNPPDATNWPEIIPNYVNPNLGDGVNVDGAESAPDAAEVP